MSGVINGAEIFINMDELMDYSAEYERLGKEKKKLESEVARGEKKLGNEGFVAKAPENVIAMEREKLENYKANLAKVTDRLALVAKKLGK